LPLQLRESVKKQINMKKHYNEYCEQIKKISAQGTEHTYRTHFENLLNHVKPDQNIRIVHEPERKKGFGAPDFRIEKNRAITGYIETKKPDENLDKIRRSEQIKKYLNLSDNLILTDYKRFMLFKDGNPEPIDYCNLFDISESSIRATDKLISKFFMAPPTLISDSKDLAVYLADRGKILREYICEILKNNQNHDFSRKIQGLYETFRETLVKDLKTDEFADAYAQTVIYGLFLARLQSGQNITLSLAGSLIPVSFKVIKEFFSFISYDYSIPNHVSWIFKEITNLINNIDLKMISRSLSFEKKDTKQLTDPYLYFYETFLGAFDPQKRKSKGVYYTPPQVVSFITRCVDEILTDKFSISTGFADPCVTFLDFATGTGTFLVAVFELILNRIREKDAGSLHGVIQDHILKNFYGFEYLVAPYAVAHLKLSRLLQDNGYEFKDNERLQVYLTDTLDDSEHKSVTLFPVISDEGEKANEIKIDKQILVITGNPPYSNRSTGKRIEGLIEDYKPKQEKKLNLNDDYIKFIRFAHNKMEKVKQGVTGIITNNSFLNGLTHRRMRSKFLEDFDEIYILNLHGNARIGETCPDGSIDQNVFDIMQGVSINIFVKKEKRDKKCRVFYYDLYGQREVKHDFLISNNIKSVNWKELEIENFDKSFKKTQWGKNRFKENLSFFVPGGNIKVMKDYGEFLGVTDIFKEYNSGIQTKRDKLTVQFYESDMKQVVNDFQKLTDMQLREKYQLQNDSSGWNLPEAREILINSNRDENNINEYQYRPFDVRYTYFTEKQGFLGRPRYKTMKHFLKKENIGLCFSRQIVSEHWKHIFITNKILDACLVSIKTREWTYIAPLYIYHDSSSLTQNNGQTEKMPNFTKRFQRYIKKQYPSKTATPEQILGYIYAVMHSPVYRKTYLEFLKIDFPRIPFTSDFNNFKTLSDLGTELIEHHLMKKSYPDNQVSFPQNGDDVVQRIRFVCDKNTHTGNIFINKDQYFGNIPVHAWEFYIGGYKVLDKWLKSRKNRVLTYQEKEHFKKIVNILNFTHRCMHRIEKLFAHSGF
jgi:predicted helicase